MSGMLKGPKATYILERCFNLLPVLVTNALAQISEQRDKRVIELRGPTGNWSAKSLEDRRCAYSLRRSRRAGS
jgi:hypothetical protein